MNPRTVLAASLCLNLGMVAAIAFVIHNSKEPTPAPAVEQTKTIVKTNVVQKTSVSTELVQLDWRSVESAEFKEYIAKLRRIGCPEETIRDIIIADVNKLYAARWKNMIAPPTEPLKYWEAYSGQNEYYDRKLLSQKRAMEREKKALIKDLLGVDYDKEMRNYEMNWALADREARLMDFLPEPKRSQVIDIHAKTREMVQLINERAKGGELSKEDQDEAAKAREWERVELRKLLTPEEYEGYQLRISATANTLRSQMTGFNPTEQDFITLFRAQRDYNDVVNKLPGTPQDPENRQQRVEAGQQMEAKIKQALGDQRYAEYQRGKDYTYQELVRYTQQAELPIDMANKVYDLRQTAQQQSLVVRQNADFTPEQQRTAIQAIQAETQKAIQQTLGDDNYKSFQRTRGYLLQNGIR